MFERPRDWTTDYNGRTCSRFFCVTVHPDVHLSGFRTTLRDYIYDSLIKGSTDAELPFSRTEPVYLDTEEKRWIIDTPKLVWQIRRTPNKIFYDHYYGNPRVYYLFYYIHCYSRVLFNSPSTNRNKKNSLMDFDCSFSQF